MDKVEIYKSKRHTELIVDNTADAYHNIWEYYHSGKKVTLSDDQDTIRKRWISIYSMFVDLETDGEPSKRIMGNRRAVIKKHVEIEKISEPIAYDDFEKAMQIFSKNQLSRQIYREMRENQIMNIRNLAEEREDYETVAKCDKNINDLHKIYPLPDENAERKAELPPIFLVLHEKAHAALDMLVQTARLSGGVNLAQLYAHKTTDAIIDEDHDETADQ